jgi:hypothetical protein
MMDKRAIHIFLFILLPLVIGTAIYLLMRQGAWLHHFTGVGRGSSVIVAANGLQKIFANQGPDFCWCFSLASALFIFQTIAGIKSNTYALLVLIVLVLSEVIQLLFPGQFTFDWWDVGAAVLAFLLSFILNRSRYEKKS